MRCIPFHPTQSASTFLFYWQLHGYGAALARRTALLSAQRESLLQQLLAKRAALEEAVRAQLEAIDRAAAVLAVSGPTCALTQSMILWGVPPWGSSCPPCLRLRVSPAHATSFSVCCVDLIHDVHMCDGKGRWRRRQVVGRW